MRELGGVVAALMALALAGCASPKTTVQPERVAYVADNLPPPSVILVQKIGVNMNEVRDNREFFGKGVDGIDGNTLTEQAAQLVQEVSNDFTNELVSQINALGLPAQRATRGTTTPLTALVIVGFFTDVDAGSEAKRLVIGLGSGESKLDAQLQLLQPRSTGEYRPLLEFSTHADSGEKAGAVETLGVGAAVQAAGGAGSSGGKTYRTAMGAMAARSADKAAAYLSRFFADHGWIAADKVRPL